MGNSFNITVHDDRGHYQAELVELSPSATPLAYLSFGGKRYSINARNADLLKVLDILNVLYPGAVTSSAALPNRVSRANACLESLSRQTTMASGLGGSATASASLDATNPWLASDKAYLANIKQSFAEKYLAKKEADPAPLKGFLIHATHKQSDIADFARRFDEAFSTKDPKLFLPLLDHVSEYELIELIEAERFDIPLRQNIFPTQESLRALDSYIHDPKVGFSGVITLQDTKGAYTLGSKDIDPATPFAIHSIGKVFTGMLALRLVREEIIPEKALNDPVQLSEDVLAALPDAIRTHIKVNKPTLKQLMLHQGGLGDYLVNYSSDITEAVLSGKSPPEMNRPEDFLRYAEATTGPLGEEHYSNLGLLLVGLSLQHLTGTHFDTLLQDHITKPAGMTCFTSKKPDGARWNALDPTAEHICGSPAGGYWTTATDLCRFGTWASSQWADPRFLALVKEYGGEFYSKDEISHSGGITSASAYLSAFPEHGVTIAIVSDKKHPGAKEMNDAIRSHMLHVD